MIKESYLLGQWEMIDVSIPNKCFVSQLQFFSFSFSLPYSTPSERKYLILEDNLLTCLQTHYPSHHSSVEKVVAIYTVLVKGATKGN